MEQHRQPPGQAEETQPFTLPGTASQPIGEGETPDDAVTATPGVAGGLATPGSAITIPIGLGRALPDEDATGARLDSADTVEQDIAENRRIGGAGAGRSDTASR